MINFRVESKFKKVVYDLDLSSHITFVRGNDCLDKSLFSYLLRHSVTLDTSLFDIDVNDEAAVKAYFRSDRAMIYTKSIVIVTDEGFIRDKLFSLYLECCESCYFIIVTRQYTKWLDKFEHEVCEFQTHPGNPRVVSLHRLVEKV